MRRRFYTRGHQVALIGGRNRYLLDDEFSDTRAAGAVNGTPATPGPGTRNVTLDSGNALSTGAGVLNIASGAGVSGDPSIWYGGIARAFGRVLVGSITPALTTTVRWPLGFGQAAGGVPSANALRMGAAGTLQVVDSGSSSAVVGVYTAGTAYRIALALRATGCYYFIKGGAFTAWTLLWASATNNTATVYPGSSDFNGAYTVDFLRIPLALWTGITPLAYDTFTRADGAIGSTETTGPDSQAVNALPWTNQLGTVAISGNTAIATALDVDRAICTVPTSTADLLLDANVTKTTTGAGIVLRYQDADNYVYIWHNGANLLFVSRAAGIETTLVNAAAAYGAGRTLRGILSGTSGSAYYNNVQIGATQVVPASTYAVHGLIFFDTDSTLDIFQAFPRGASNEYATLDRWSGTNP